MYTEFLSCVQEATGNRMEPLCVHMDFERALGNTWSKVFPNAPVFRDHFHFNHALVHFCQAHGLKDYAQEFSQDGNVLWYASSKADFDMSLRVFMEKWSAKQPRLATYFRDVYLNSYPPEEWASFGRPSNALPGSASAEAFHGSWKKSKPCALRIDDMVDELWKSDQYHERERKDPQSWARIKDAQRKSRERYINQQLARQRRGSGEYVDRRLDTAHHSEEFNSRMLGSDGSSTNEEDVIDLLGSTPPPQARPTSSQAQQAASSSSLLNDSSLCVCCQKTKQNGSCSLRCCKKCCVKSTRHCRITDHMRSKVGTSPRYTEDLSKGPTVAEDPQFLDRIESAIKTRGSVFILYNGNTVPRKITPHEIVSGSLGKLVKAHCFLQNDERSFYVFRMKRVERNDWTLARNEDTPETPIPTSVEAWLNSIDCGEYWPVFKQNGFDKIGTLEDLTDPYLRDFGVLPGHRAMLLRGAKKISDALVQNVK